jgi:pilus assembly protein CpaE
MRTTSIAPDRVEGRGPNARRIGVIEGAVGGVERQASLAALFPHVDIAFLSANAAEGNLETFDILIIGADAPAADAFLARLRRMTPKPRVIVVLRDADVTNTRRLVREGAADVLTWPVSEPALALSIERLLASETAPAAPARKTGELVVVMKAGGGVGASSLAAQVAANLAARDRGAVCLADFDVQFGTAALYLDVPQTMSISDALSLGSAVADTPFNATLASHRSGVRVLAAPADLMALEAVGVTQVEALIRGLKRDFALTLVDLPSVWTAWTHRVITLSDRIVLVTKLSVPHIQAVKRQLRMLTSQQLDSRDVILVCNAMNADQQANVSVKAAERALGREFDVVIPEDSRTMMAAINQGVELASVKRGTKLEKGVADLAGRVASAMVDPPVASRRPWR